MLKTVNARLNTPYSEVEKYLAIKALLKNPKNIEITVPANIIPVPLAIFCRAWLASLMGITL